MNGIVGVSPCVLDIDTNASTVIQRSKTVIPNPIKPIEIFLIGATIIYGFPIIFAYVKRR
jgi:hypothetical protein